MIHTYSHIDSQTHYHNFCYQKHLHHLYKQVKLLLDSMFILPVSVSISIIPTFFIEFTFFFKNYKSWIPFSKSFTPQVDSYWAKSCVNVNAFQYFSSSGDNLTLITNRQSFQNVLKIILIT